MFIGQLGVITIGAFEVHHLTDFVIPKCRHNDISIGQLRNFLVWVAHFSKLILFQFIGVT